MRLLGWPAKIRSVALLGLNLTWPARPMSWFGPGPPIKSRVAEPAVFPGRAAPAGQVSSTVPWPLSIVVATFTLGSMTIWFLAVRPPKTMIRLMSPIPGWVESSTPLTLTWMTAPPSAEASGNWAMWITFFP